MPAVVTSVNVSPTGGVPKPPIGSAAVHATGVIGDKQNNLKYHGGPLRAVCLYSQDRIDALRDEGHPITPGSIGENITIAGLDWDAVVPGVRLAIGEVIELEVTQYTVPCSKIAGSFFRADILRVGQTANPGWSRVYTKVLKDGPVRVGDAVRLIEGNESWTIVRSTAPSASPEPGMIRQLLALSPHLMLVKHQFKKGWVGAAHAHPHHQLVYVVNGSIAITVAGETQTARAGDSFIVEGGIEHQATALEDAEVLDVFTPIRDDYRPPAGDP